MANNNNHLSYNSPTINPNQHHENNGIIRSTGSPHPYFASSQLYASSLVAANPYKFLNTASAITANYPPKQPRLTITQHPRTRTRTHTHTHTPASPYAFRRSVDDFFETVHLRGGSIMTNNNYNRPPPAIMMNSQYHEEEAATYENAHQRQQQQLMLSRVNNYVINIDDDDDDDGGAYDNIHKNGEEEEEGGLIRCLAESSRRNGPYTCPRCMRVLLTSQQFAAHVSSFHYRFESEEQRRKRHLAKMTAKTRTPLKIQHAKDGSLTIAPLHFSHQWEAEAEQLHANAAAGGAITPTTTAAYSSSKELVVVKEEEQEVAVVGRGNDSVIPPGFEGVVKIKGEY